MSTRRQAIIWTNAGRTVSSSELVSKSSYLFQHNRTVSFIHLSCILHGSFLSLLLVHFVSSLSLSFSLAWSDSPKFWIYPAVIAHFHHTQKYNIYIYIYTYTHTYMYIYILFTYEGDITHNQPCLFPGWIRAVVCPLAAAYLLSMSMQNELRIVCAYMCVCVK